MTDRTPQPLGSYDEATALLVVDMQNDFAHPEGSLYVDGGHELVPQVNAEIVEARARGALVVYSKDTHPESTPHFEKDGGVWPVHCLRDSWGWQFHADLVVDSAAPIVLKGVEGGDGYSAFSVRDPASGDEHETDLEAILDEHAIERLVIVGLAQDFCVKETALGGLERGYDTEVLTGATAPVNLQPDDGERALEEISGAGAQLV